MSDRRAAPAADSVNAERAAASVYMQVDKRPRRRAAATGHGRSAARRTVVLFVMPICFFPRTNSGNVKASRLRRETGGLRFNYSHCLELIIAFSASFTSSFICICSDK